MWNRVKSFWEEPFDFYHVKLFLAQTFFAQNGEAAYFFPPPRGGGALGQNIYQWYSDKSINAYFYDQMLFKIFVAKRDTGRGYYSNFIWVSFLLWASPCDANFAARGGGGQGAGEGCKPPIIQSALLDYNVSFLIVVCYILACKLSGYFTVHQIFRLLP